MAIWTATEDERQAEARELIRRHGDDLPRIMAAECHKLADVGDWDGIGRWAELIQRCEAIRTGTPYPPPPPEE